MERHFEREERPQSTPEPQPTQRAAGRGGRPRLPRWRTWSRRLLAVSLRLWLVAMVAISLFMAYLANARLQRQAELAFIEQLRQPTPHQPTPYPVRIVAAAGHTGPQIY
jgi:hypothetical protein